VELGSNSVCVCVCQEASSGEEDAEKSALNTDGMTQSKKVAEIIKVTEKMVKEWRSAIRKDPTPRLLREVTQAFKAAVATTKGEGSGPCKYKVADSSGMLSRPLGLIVEYQCSKLCM